MNKLSQPHIKACCSNSIIKLDENASPCEKIRSNLQDLYSALVDSEFRLQKMLKLLEVKQCTWDILMVNVDFGTNEPSKLIYDLKGVISNWLYQCDLCMK